jgi:hypothetical protein
MASSNLPAAIADSFVKGMVVPETAVQVRRAIYNHGTLRPDDMDLVFKVARKAGPNACTEWTQLFSEAVADYVVHQNDAGSCIPEQKANWLIAALQEGGGISTKAEFAMLIDVMNSALGVPASLSAFGLSEIKTAILKGRRGAFTDEDHPAGVVTKPDVEALRAILFAATSGSACHITQEEAEALFDIAHATAKGKVDPSFEDLFARAVGNYLMAISMHVPSESEELHREKWLDEREKLPGFFSRIIGNKSTMGFFDMLKTPLELADEGMAKLDAEDDRERAKSEKITDQEADWVAAHLTRDGKLTSAETRLLKWLGDEASSLPPKLKSMVEKANSFGRRAAS